MAQIPKETVEQVLLATDIVELIQSYIPVKRAGSAFKANCPFHQEKTPSFTINPVRQSFHCFGCGKGGDAISFVREYENLPFMDAVRKLAMRAGVVVVEEQEDLQAVKARRSRGKLLDLHREAAAFFHELLLRDRNADHAREYLKSRGFGKEMAVRWAIGWMPERAEVFLEWARKRKFSGRELVDSGLAALRNEERPGDGIYVRFRDRLMFPVRNEIGDVIAFSGRQLREDPRSGKYINSPETAIFKKSNVLFALDRAKKPILKEKAVLLCEGQIDVIACHEAGVEHAIAPLGTAFTPQHAKLLKRYTKQVVLCYDADQAGVTASTRAFRELAVEGLTVKVVTMPMGDDPDTFIKAHGADAFRIRIAEAKEFFDFKLGMDRNGGRLEGAADRAAVMNECAGLLAVMSDPMARDHQVNLVASHLQSSTAALREAIALAKRRQRRSPVNDSEAKASEAVAVEPTGMHRIVECLCHLALSSASAQHLLAEQFETLHEADRWLEGIPLLEKILGAAPDPKSSSAVNAFLSSLPQADRLALTGGFVAMEGVPEDEMQAAEHALALLSATVLQRRDAAVKAALREPGLSAEKITRLLEEAKEISSLMRGIGQRSEFDDELPASTWKPKEPPWKQGRPRGNWGKNPE